MTKAAAYLRIIIPQAIIVALPNYFNFVMGAFMGTSVVFLIGVQDIMSWLRSPRRTVTPSWRPM
jgi:ABC-type arginine/histidine transport system permease subunit